MDFDGSSVFWCLNGLTLCTATFSPLLPQEQQARGEINFRSGIKLITAELQSSQKWAAVARGALLGLWGDQGGPAGDGRSRLNRER
jgi:hypothetical protein